MARRRTGWIKTLAPLWALALSGVVQAEPSAEDLLRLGQVDQGILQAKQDARKRPTDMVAQELYIDLLLSMGLAGRAAGYCDARRRSEPSDPDAHYLVGRAARTAADAQSAYEAALRLDPDHARSFMGMAAVHTASGRRDAAVSGYARAVQLDPSLSEAWLGLIREVSFVDATEALQVARQAKVAVPAEPGVYLWLDQLEPAAALGHLTDGLAMVPVEARLHAAYAVRLFEAGRVGEAGVAADAALQRQPQNVAALKVELYAREFGSSRLDMAGYRQIQTLLQGEPDPNLWGPLIERHPTSALTWLGRANARRASGDLPGHDRDLKQAVVVDPSNIEARGAWGLRLLSLERAEEAMPHLEEAARARPWDVSLGLALAVAVGATEGPTEQGALLTVLAERHTMDLRVARTRAQWFLDQKLYEDAYRYTRETLQRLPDGQLGVALVASALQTGRHQEAAALVESIGEEVGNTGLIEAARQLRARGAGG